MVVFAPIPYLHVLSTKSSSDELFHADRGG